MNLIQAFAWNVGTYGLMLREYSSGSPARREYRCSHRGRLNCSSDEFPVMGMERRIQIISFNYETT